MQFPSHYSRALAALNWGGFSVQFKGSLILLAGLIILSLGLALLVYRRTLPPAGLALRLILAFLRALALILLLFLIFEPSISRHIERRLKPLLAVIFDDTASMNLSDASGPRRNQLAELMNDPSWKDLADRFDMKFFAAGDSLRPIGGIFADSLQLGSIGTDLARYWCAALSSYDGGEYSACVLVSDGGDNAGLNPVREAQESPVPIFTIGVGDTTPVRDAWIASFSGVDIAYQGKKTQLTARIRARDLPGRSARLELRGAQGEILLQRQIKLPADHMDTEVSLEFTPQQTGMLPLKLQLATSEDEWRTDNNVRSFPLEVRESRIRILCLSGRPGFEALFFRQTAANLPDIEINSLTFKNDGTILGGDSRGLAAGVARADVLVLLEFSRKSMSPAAVERLRGALRDHPLPIWVWLGAQPDTKALQALMAKLPFRVRGRISSAEAEAVPDDFYSELDPDAESAEFSLWRDLPPVDSPPFAVQISGTARTLIHLQDPETGQARGPALLTWETGGRRFAVTLGGGYWRWHFLNLGLGGTAEIYQGYLARVLRWLATAPEQKPLKMNVERNLYSSGQAVKFNARVLGGKGQFISSARVEAFVKGPSTSAHLILEPDNRGQYSGSFQPDEVGMYSFEGLAMVEADTVGCDSGSFMVEAYNVEKETLSQNRALLESIAKASGGVYLPADSLAQLSELIQARPRLSTIEWSRRFFLNWDLLGALIILLGLEWFIRKRRGML